MTGSRRSRSRFRVLKTGFSYLYAALGEQTKIVSAYVQLPKFKRFGSVISRLHHLFQGQRSPRLSASTSLGSSRSAVCCQWTSYRSNGKRSLKPRRVARHRKPMRKAEQCMQCTARFTYSAVYAPACSGPQQIPGGTSALGWTTS